MTTKQIFDRAVIVGMEQELNDHVKNLQWSTDEKTLKEKLQNQIVQAMGIPRRFLFGDD